MLKKKLQQTAAVILFGLAFAGCGCLFLWLMGQVTTLSCRRVETAYINCDMQTSWLGLIPTGERSIQRLEAAQVEESCDSDGCTYRVALTTFQGQVPLTGFYTSGHQPKAELAQQINTFVQDRTAPSLQLKQSEVGLFMLLPLLFIGVGSLIMAAGIAPLFTG